MKINRRLKHSADVIMVNANFKGKIISQIKIAKRTTVSELENNPIKTFIQYDVSYILKRTKLKSIPLHLTSQVNEVITQLNKGELFNFNNLRYLIENNVNTNYVKRLRLLRNLKATDSKIALIIRYGYIEGVKRYQEKKNRSAGENNPWFNHNGKMSRLSKNHVYYDENIRLECAKKISEALKVSDKSTTNIKHYLKDGFNEEQAKQMLAKRQSTFSLINQIEKYGEEEGTKRFIERQIKWQETLNSKPQKEKDRINILKGTGRMNALFNSNESVKHVHAILYYVRFYKENTEVFKLGITSVGINKRFRLTNGWKLELLWKEEDTFYNCFKKEQALFRVLKNKRIIIKEPVTTTEAFSENVLDMIIETRGCSK